MTTLDRLLLLARTAAAADDSVTPAAVRAVVLNYSGAETPARVAAGLAWLMYVQGRYLPESRILAPKVRA